MEHLRPLALLPLLAACVGAPPDDDVGALVDAPPDAASAAPLAPPSGTSATPAPTRLDEVAIDPDFDFRATHAVRLKLAAAFETPLVVRVDGSVIFRGSVPAGGQALSWPIALHAQALELEWRDPQGQLHSRAVPLEGGADLVLEEVL